MIRLKRRQPQAEPPRYSGPADEIVYAVGDVHGCLDQLDLLLDRIAADIAVQSMPSHLVFLGDYIDRGPDSAGVIERLSRSTLPGDRQSFLMGNHEEIMLAALDGDRQALAAWLRHGAYDTLRSYGIEREEVLGRQAAMAALVEGRVPDDHLSFIAGCVDMVRLGDFLFVHAGIRPGIPLDRQDPADLRWIRKGFVDDVDTDHGVMVVHGHSITKAPDIRRNRIGIDTGCYKTGVLTALRIDGRSTHFLQAESGEAQSRQENKVK